MGVCHVVLYCAQWKILSRSVLCCCCSTGRDADVEAPVTVTRSTTLDAAAARGQEGAADVPNLLEEAIAEAHNVPLYPPGRIVHIVRSHNDNKG